MSAPNNTDPEKMDPELDETIDEISEKISDSLVSKVIRWAIRTIIGLILFGTLWHFYKWGFWLFWGYVILAPVSLAALVYLHYKLVKRLAQILAEPDGADNGENAASDL